MLNIKNWDPKALTLSVEWVDLILLLAEEGSIGKVLFVAVKNNFCMLTDLPSDSVVEKVMVGQCWVVIKIHKDQVVCYKTASDVWVRKALVRHRIIINIKRFVDVKLFFFNLFWCSRLFPKCSDPELPIVHVSSYKIITFFVLFYFFKLDVTVRLASYSFLECQFVSLKRVLFDVVLPIISLGDCHHRFRVVGDPTRNDWVHSNHVFAFC